MLQRAAVRLFLTLVLAFGAFGSWASGPVSVRAAQQQPAGAAGPFVPGEIVIQFRPGSADADKAQARAGVGAARRQAVSRPGQGDLELSTLPPGLAVADAVRSLQAHPAVAFAEPNFLYFPDAVSNDPYMVDGSLWGMAGDATTPANPYGSQAGDAWARGYTGSRGVVVAVIDRGIDVSHPDLAENIWRNPQDGPDGVNNDGNCTTSNQVKTDSRKREYVDPATNCDAGGYIDDVHGWDFVNDDGSVYDPGSADETDGHGTHVAGTIGAVGGNGRGVAGVNWQASIISIKYLGSSTTFNLAKALDYLIDLKQRQGLNLVATNNSYGGQSYSKSVHAAIIRAAKANILFIASAGNEGANNDTTPRYPSNYDSMIPVLLSSGAVFESAAAYDNVIAVAALDSNGVKRSSSNYGATTVDLAAPGGGILSTVPNGEYGSKSGTSMAAPHVTGAVVLYAASNPGASGAQMRAALLGSTTLTASLSGLTATGGRLNVETLVAGATPTPTPTATLAPPTATPSTPTVTAVPATATPSTPTATAVPPTATPVPPTATNTPVSPTATATAAPATSTPTPSAPSPTPTRTRKPTKTPRDR